MIRTWDTRMPGACLRAFKPDGVHSVTSLEWVLAREEAMPPSPQTVCDRDEKWHYKVSFVGDGNEILLTDVVDYGNCAYSSHDQLECQIHHLTNVSSVRTKIVLM